MARLKDLLFRRLRSRATWASFTTVRSWPTTYELLLDNDATGVIELPVEWIRDDAVYFNMDRFTILRPYTPPLAVLEIFKAEFDAAFAEGDIFQM